MELLEKINKIYVSSFNSQEKKKKKLTITGIKKGLPPQIVQTLKEQKKEECKHFSADTVNNLDKISK